MRAVRHVEQLAAYALADLGGQRRTLAQNESAYPPSPLAIAAGHAALENAALYPDPDWTELRAAIAAQHGLDPATILCGTGSMDLISCTIRAFAGPGREVLAPRYGYLFAATATAQADATYVTVDEARGMVDVDGLLRAVTPATAMVFLCNPGNPTGTRIPSREILRLRDGLPASVLLVVDQAYGEFDDQDHRAVFGLVARGDTVVLRTFSKAYGLAGVRIGWGVFPPEVGREVRKLQNSNDVTVIALAMAAAAMRDQLHMRDVVARTAATRAIFAEGLTAAGYAVLPSHTNFVMVRLADRGEADRAHAALLGAGLIARQLGGYGLADSLRITIGLPEEMQAALAVLTGLAPR
ncbi:aminotransferase class I/II-fold pyridoxal phosphate-dependent enzyme [Ancylobacter sp. A5.8]|uniref:pyridoxal phosphate-dependent aminotransferase n=1 Tax=Ancylobacter gelatini TaxID=2919920 RepID=UPI001F4E0526|nr:histidinol-phosphate transaminase [Ancylobacter gelatini]MCJ8143908.1 aminotransferase class I/II-fold pyridoxal phosphate-dependent enzyme [Ancylobacter gelatini]